MLILSDGSQILSVTTSLSRRKDANSQLLTRPFPVENKSIKKEGC